MASIRFVFSLRGALWILGGIFLVIGGVFEKSSLYLHQYLEEALELLGYYCILATAVISLTKRYDYPPMKDSY